MAMQTGKGSIFSKYGARVQTAVKAHATDAIERKSFGNLPAGVQGVAKLIEIKFDTVKAEEGKDKKHVGEYFFYAAGIVEEPVVFVDEKGNKHKCAGLRTNVTEMICDTPEKTGKNARKTVEQHIQWVMHLCRESLGAKFTGASPQELEAWVAAVNAAIKNKTKPMLIYFNFETWKGNKATTGPYKDQEPQVQHFWRELEAGYVAPNHAAAGVQETVSSKPDDDDEDEEEEKENEEVEETEETPEEEEQEEEKPVKKGKSGGKSAIKAKNKDKVKKEEEEEQEEQVDLVALAERADQHNDTKAKTQLTVLAKEAGIAKETIRDADSWADIVALMQGKGTEEEEQEEEQEDEEPEEEEEESEEEDSEVPEVENMVGYKPLNKDGKEFKTPVECIITAVSSKAKTADLKNLGNNKVYKAVPWDKLLKLQS